MDKAEINNEIVSLRHMVRQARVCTVNKLVKEAKLLRNKHGTIAQQEKYKRKADKLIAEIYVLKKVKDDEISKFGILNEKELKDILQNQSYSDRDRIIAKVAYYKSFYKRIIQFKEKFPNYKKYLSEGKKKEVRKSKKTKTKKSLEKNTHSPQDEKLMKQEINSDKNIEPSRINSDKNIELSTSESNSTDDETCKTKLHEKKINSHKSKNTLNKNVIATDKEKLVEDKISKNVAEQRNILCSVTKEAVVKRFEEFIEEKSIEDEQTPIESTVPISTTTITPTDDDFFITGNSEMDYGENFINTSMSSTRFDNSVKAFRSSNRSNRTQNANYRNDTYLNKIKKHNQPRNQLKDKKISQREKYLDKRSLAIEEKKEVSEKINKDNSSDINNKEENANLHPSWLAKKKQQEMMSQGFQGKKIVFAD